MKKWVLAFVVLCGFDGDCLQGCQGGGFHGQSPPVRYLTDTVAKRLSFEIDAVEGFAPNPDALSDFTARLEQLRQSKHLRKPDGIRVLMDDTLPPHATPDHAYTSEEVHALFNQRQDLRNQDDAEATATILYLDGHFAEDTAQGKVLGFAYHGDRIAIFAKTIREACSGQVFADSVCRLAEASVLVHEFGHLLGLVNNGLNMTRDHQDEEHGAHDSDPGCVMYWAIESSSGISQLVNRLLGGDSGVPAFDAACLDDMMAAHARY